METAQKIRPKLWEEMSFEEQHDLRRSWDKQASDFRLKIEGDYWKSQEVIRLLRDKAGVHCQTLKDLPSAEKSSAQLPEEEGHYLWYVIDWGYADVGLVQVMKDRPKHLAYLKEQFDKGSRSFLVYQNSKGETLSMYHQANDHLPHWNKDGIPWVDGYLPFDFAQFK